jgi:hypothetical protein
MEPAYSKRDGGCYGMDGLSIEESAKDAGHPVETHEKTVAQPIGRSPGRNQGMGNCNLVLKKNQLDDDGR